MWRQWIKEHLPKKEVFQRHPRLRWLGNALFHPNLWHFNRRSTSRAVAAGLFVTCIPIPFQLLMSAVAAILVKANLPITVLLSVINNPFTFIPINYFFYRLGSLILHEKINVKAMEFSWQLHNIHAACISLLHWLVKFGKPYFTGLAVVSIGSALIGYFLVLLIWRIDITIRWRRHQRFRKQKNG